MNLENTFFFISILFAIGSIQSSVENIILFSKFPAIVNFPLEQGIIKSNIAKRLSFLYNSSGSWVFTTLKLLAAIALLVTALKKEAYFIIPLILLLSDVLGFARWKFLPSSDVPMQRLILVGLIIHSYFNDPFISSIVLIAITTFLCLFYFASGYKKLRSRDWKNGSVLANFFGKNSLADYENKKVLRWLGYGIILFECSFFIALANINLAVLYLIIGFLFHLYLYLKHQLNFFFWTFVSTYFAFYYIAQQVSLLF